MTAGVKSRPGEAVVCLHGLWLSGYATGYWRAQFIRAGFAAYAYSYPTVRSRLALNRSALARFVESLPEQRIHFAGHSLGALTIVSMLDDLSWRLPGKELGRIVLAGPPFQDSHAGKALIGTGRARPVLGRLGATMAGRPLRDWLAGTRPCVPLGVDLGVIAGDSSIGLGRIIAPGLPRPHDGTVSVEETRVVGAREHLVLPVGHTGMLMSPTVVKRMIRFFESGSFE